jgi:hypothetical protein
MTITEPAAEEQDSLAAASRPQHGPSSIDVHVPHPASGPRDWFRQRNMSDNADCCTIYGPD